MVENRLLGIKSREVHEAPAGRRASRRAPRAEAFVTTPRARSHRADVGTRLRRRGVQRALVHRRARGHRRVRRRRAAARDGRPCALKLFQAATARSWDGDRRTACTTRASAPMATGIGSITPQPRGSSGSGASRWKRSPARPRARPTPNVARGVAVRRHIAHVASLVGPLRYRARTRPCSTSTPRSASIGGSSRTTSREPRLDARRSRDAGVLSADDAEAIRVGLTESSSAGDAIRGSSPARTKMCTRSSSGSWSTASATQAGGSTRAAHATSRCRSISACTSGAASRRAAGAAWRRCRARWRIRPSAAGTR